MKKISKEDLIKEAQSLVSKISPLMLSKSEGVLYEIFKNGKKEFWNLMINSILENLKIVINSNKLSEFNQLL